MMKSSKKEGGGEDRHDTEKQRDDWTIERVTGRKRWELVKGTEERIQEEGWKNEKMGDKWWKRQKTGKARVSPCQSD